MFIISLKFSDNKKAAQEFMAAHNDWLSQGFADGIFQCAGSIKPAGGGAVLAHGESFDLLKTRVEADPFVQNNIVVAEITEIDVKRTVAALNFLKE